MSTYAVEVTKVLSVDHHPDADRLSIVHVKGFVCISGKLDDGSHRYAVGDLVAYIPEASVFPEWLLKEMDFWNDEKGIGFLAGKQGDRLKAKRLRGIFSQGVLYPIRREVSAGITLEWLDLPNKGFSVGVVEGVDVSEHLGLTKYEPPIPAGFAGDVCNIAGKTHGYDFESVQNYPDTFDADDDVVATEKLHGTHVQIGYIPELNNSELFYDGNLYVGSKGMAAKGLVFKDNETNAAKNIYVRMLKPLVEDGFGLLIKAISEAHDNKPVRVFGEIFGTGIQDLTYGFKKPVLYIFDIQIGYDFVSYDKFEELAASLGLPIAPVLYRGKYDTAELVKVRDGKDSLSGTNVREGIVIKTAKEARGNYGRKIGKWVSPDYILRNNATEYN